VGAVAVRGFRISTDTGTDFATILRRPFLRTSGSHNAELAYSLVKPSIGSAQMELMTAVNQSVGRRLERLETPVEIHDDNTNRE
jgi:hypothetical protein